MGGVRHDVTSEAFGSVSCSHQPVFGLNSLSSILCQTHAENTIQLAAAPLEAFFPFSA